MCLLQTGYVTVDDEEYLIEPIKGHNISSDVHHPHLVYKRSALSRFLAQDQTPSDQDHDHQSGTCGNEGKRTRLDRIVQLKTTSVSFSLGRKTDQ